jgi:hypothetical protein
VSNFMASWSRRENVLLLATTAITGVVVGIFADRQMQPQRIVVESGYIAATPIAFAPTSTPVPTMVLLTPTATPAATGRFKVRAWVDPSTMPYDSYPTLYAATRRGAVCSAHVDYSTGYAPVSFSGTSQEVGASGRISWSWHEETEGDSGVANINCVYGRAEGLATTSFTVTR